MPTTSKIFVLCFFGLALFLVGCGGGLTPAEQAEVDKYLKEHGRNAIAHYVGDLHIQTRHHLGSDLTINEKSTIKVIKSLISKGADVNAATYSNVPALYLAEDLGLEEVAKYLESRGAK